MSRLLFLNACYAPDVAATAQYFRDLAAGMTARGYEATVVAANSPYGGGATRWSARERLDGVEVVRVDAGRDHGHGYLSRLLRFARLFSCLFLAVLRHPTPSIIVCGTSPPFLPVLGALLGAIRRVPVVFWLLDNYPDAAESVGLIRSRGWLARCLDWPIRVALASSAVNVVIGRCMLDRLARFSKHGGRFEFISLWPLEGAADSAVAATEIAAMRVMLGAGPEQSLVVYSGNLGRGHDIERLELLVDALSKNPAVAIAFVGNGFGYERLKRYASSRGLPRCTFHLPVERARLAVLLAAADVHLVSLSAAASGAMVPSKFYGVMGAGRPCLFVGPKGSEIGRVIGEDRAGLVFDDVDSTLVAESLSALVADRSMRREFEAGAARAAARFSREKMLTRWAQILGEITAASAPNSRG